MRVPQPIPYQGSKRNLAPVILNYFPSGQIRVIEPFAGSAAISILSAVRGVASEIILNDINEPLMDLWNEIINSPEHICALYSKLWHEQLGNERQYYQKVKDEFNKTHNPEYLLYLLARCVKAAVRYSSKGDFNQGADHRRKGKQPETMEREIFQVSKLLKGKTSLHSTDYSKILSLAGPSDIVYMDPPYQGVTKNKDPRYFNGLKVEDFIDQLFLAKERNLRVIISYDGSVGDKKFGQDLPDELDYVHLHIRAGRSSQATLNGQTHETIESLYVSRNLGIVDDGQIISCKPEQALLCLPDGTVKRDRRKT